jgi:D-aminopeptidase
VRGTREDDVEKKRARDAGIKIGHLTPCPNDAITDVGGVRVGHSTIVRGEGPVRTGVTVVCSREGLTRDEPAFAGCHRLNGNGEMTGLEWIRESGVLTSPVAITNTHSVGVVRDALIAAELEARTDEAILNALLAAGTVSGRDGITAHGLAPDLLLGALDEARGLCARRDGGART